MKLKMFFCVLFLGHTLHGMEVSKESVKRWIERKYKEIFLPSPLHVRYVQEYNALSESARSKLFSEKLDGYQSVLGKKGDAEKFVVAVAFGLMAKTKYLKVEKMYALGQSMSYYVLTARILEQVFGGDPDLYDFLAFSGRFYCHKCHEWTLDDPEKCHQITIPQGWAGERIIDAYFHKDMLFPSDDVIAHFRDYIEEVGVCKYDTIGVCDQIEYGNGMQSFLKVMEAVGALPDYNKVPVMKLLCIDMDMSKDPCLKNTIDYDTLAKFTWESRPDVMEELEATHLNDNRLIPTYSFKEWGNIDPSSFVPHNDAKVRMFAIIHHIIQNKDAYAKDFQKLAVFKKK